MDQTSGFAATISIGQPVLQRLIRVLYNAGKLSHSIKVEIPTLKVDMFVALPVITMKWDDPTHIALDLTAWGTLWVTPPGGIREYHNTSLTTRLVVGLQASIVEGKLRFRFDSGDLTVVNPVITSLDIPWSQPSLDYFASADFQNLLHLGLGAELDVLSDDLPPIDLSSFGALTSDPSVIVRHIFRQGAVVLGLDIDVPGVLTTHGNTTQLDDATNGNDIAMWTSPAAVPIAYSSVRQDIETAVAASDGTLDLFNMRVEEGKFVISGKISHSGGNVDFSLDSVPRLVRPGVHVEYDEEYGGHVEYTTPSRDELWFEPQNVHVNVHLSWWAAMLASFGAILTLGIGAFIVRAMLDMIRGNVSSGFDQNAKEGNARAQQFTLPGVTRPPMEQKLETLECHDDGVYIGITIKATFWNASFEGPLAIGAEEILTHDVHYRIGLPADVLVEDPALDAHHTVRRVDTNEILLDYTVNRANQDLILPHAYFPYTEIDQLSIEIRVFRTLGPTVTEIFYVFTHVNLVDYLDRSHKYVQWEHQAFVPIVRVESNGAHTVLGNHIVHRRSNIHRTALPGRCQMLRRLSLQKFGDARGYPLVYTDDLPFPLANIVENRAALCDYCFFGGPTKTVPLIPTT